MKLNVRLQLSVMMFLNFFVWGIWFASMGTYITLGNMGATGAEAAQAYGTQCLGAIIAPFIIGLIADRYFAAQKILGFLHISGAILLYFISTQTSFNAFYGLLLPYMIIYMPTLALVNAIALKQVTNAEKEFGGIRLWGTVGWIAAGLLIGVMGWAPAKEIITAGTNETASTTQIQALKDAASVLKITYLVGAIASLILGIFSFSLPNTPPTKDGKNISIKEVLGLDALNVLKDKNYLIFFIASVLICIPLAFYYGSAGTFLTETGMENAFSKMTLGQVSETVFLFLLPLFFKRFGTKQMLLIGMFAWVLRYLLFAYGNNETAVWMLYAGIILHGICYDFFFVTGQIYTDKKAGENVRSSAQGLITLATYGVGMYIGFWAAGVYTDKNAITNAAGKIVNHNWQAIWIFPCLFAIGVALLFIAFFKDEKNKNTI
jgi:nucleoside transporter